MMSKMKITHRIILKQFSLIPILFVAVILFSNNTIAQEVSKVVAKTETLLAQNLTNTEDELQKEFDDLLKPFIKEKNGKYTYYGIGKETQQKLIPLYEKMGDSQKAKQIVRYWPGLQKNNPSKDEFESWKKSSEYGVWLNDKRISNDELNQFKYTDIAYFDKSRLAKNARNYGKHVYQLNALTNKNFEAYNNRIKAEPYLVFWPKGRK